MAAAVSLASVDQQTRPCAELDALGGEDHDAAAASSAGVLEVAIGPRHEGRARDEEGQGHRFTGSAAPGSAAQTRELALQERARRGIELQAEKVVERAAVGE